LAVDGESTVDPMPEIAPGITFSRLAREWRCKWSEEGGGAALIGVQEFMDNMFPIIQAFVPEAEVQRVVCGGCLDYKVIVSAPIEAFKTWEASNCPPEEKFLEALRGSFGITQVETQTYTIESLTGPAPDGGELIEKWPGVAFNRIAREWRCKWSDADDKASLVAAQKVLETHLPALKALPGVQVQRIVCGGCLDFKVITSVPADKFGDFESSGFGPEGEFLAALKATNGITQVETQTYTLQPLESVYGTMDGPAEQP